MKRRHTTPRYYARNAAMQAQRRFLRTGKTEAERLDDHREATANMLVLCILAAIYDKYGIGEMVKTSKIFFIRSARRACSGPDVLIKWG